MMGFEDGSDKEGHEKVSIMLKELVDFEHQSTTCTTTSDAGVKYIATMINDDEVVNDTHDCDDIGRSSIGNLIRVRNKT